MGIKMIFFDLDGTLLPMDQDIFTKEYFRLLTEKLQFYGYDSKRIIKATWCGMRAMVKNNGQKSNKSVFWETASNTYGSDLTQDMDIFNEYYEKDFAALRKVCGYNSIVPNIVHFLHNKNIRMALATNPIFPLTATLHRIRWSGLEYKDFEIITTYENSCYAKPNIKYYTDLISKLKVTPEECLMIGNDIQEDMIAKKTGMDVFLLTDYLINKGNENISNYQNGNFNDMMFYINTRIEEG